MKYSVLAYYVFTTIEDPEKEVREAKAFLQTLDSKGRIYIAHNGVNAQLSLSSDDVEAYQAWLDSRPIYKEAQVKIHFWHEHAFDKMSVKLKKQLVAIDREVDISKTGGHLTPKEWRERLEKKDPDTLLVDVRNKYEWEVGHFEGAILPEVNTFREFPAFAENLAKSYDTKKTKVIMYCTGGIRCEIYSALLKEEGFESVEQLKGGVIQYGLDEGNAHWKGKLFVFDDRLVVPIAPSPTESISVCHTCGKKADTYYNCANMDCNDLFVSCPECIEEKKGCCSDACLCNGRVRAFVKADHPKPFRKLHKEMKPPVKGQSVEIS